MFARQALAALLTAALVAIPVCAEPGAATAAGLPVGSVASAECTLVSSSEGVAGTTIFSGNEIQVGPQGSARLLLNSGVPVRLEANSRVQITQGGPADLLELEVMQGRAELRASADSAVSARLGDATVRPAGNIPAVIIISVLADNSAIIGASSGSARLTTEHDGKTYELTAGQGLRLRLAPASASPQNPQSPAPTATTNGPRLSGRHAAMIAWVLGGVAVGVGLVLLATKLTGAEKRNLVSPFPFP